MRKPIIISVFILLTFNAFSQDLISMSLMFSQTKEQIKQRSEYDINTQYDVDLYSVQYTTTGSDGLLDTASAAVGIPVGYTDALPFAIYHHGTVNNRYDVPSEASGESSIGFVFGSLGYIALLPDYIGMGVSRNYHPYLHAESQAGASTDLLIAIRNYLMSQGLNFSQDVYLTGYSQGGHASASTHYYLENEANFGFKVKAAAHLSGPYSLSEIMLDRLLGDDIYFFPAYIPHLLLGLNEVYGNLFVTLEQIFKPRYANVIGRLYDDAELFSVNSALLALLANESFPAAPRKMFQDSVINAIKSNSNHPINVAIRDNDLTDWSPKAPTRLIYCEADEQVPYQNAILAESRMKALGATDVQAISLNENANHSGCADFAFPFTIDFFSDIKNSTNINELEPLMYSIKNDARIVSVSNQGTNELNLAIYNAAGMLKDEYIILGGNALEVSLAQMGVYYLRCSNEMTNSTELIFIH